MGLRPTEGDENGIRVRSLHKYLLLRWLCQFGPLLARLFSKEAGIQTASETRLCLVCEQEPRTSAAHVLSANFCFFRIETRLDPCLRRGDKQVSGKYGGEQAHRLTDARRGGMTGASVIVTRHG
jgi:hypothetical protein